MNRRTVNAVIILGILSLVSILFVQIFWIRRTIHAQHVAVEIQRKEDSLNLKQFSEHVHIALRNVLEEVEKHANPRADLYGAVQQIRSNYFSVDISEELHPFYLETLLKREFDAQSLNQDFQYGIYDCYSDSIVFGNLVRYHKKGYVTADSLPDPASAKLSWKNDGHYFTVLFPNVEPNRINPAEKIDSPWVYLIVIIGLLLVFFGFSLNIIIRQKRLSEVKTDFINNMTHELKTPISTIGLSSELLLKGDFREDPDRLRRYAEIIYRENKRLENQVERVLNVAKLDKDHLVLKRVPLSLNELIRDSEESFELNQSELGGHIHLSLDAQKDTIYGDPVHITNVLYNLLDNAVKYCNTTPEIMISTIETDNGVMLCVQDNGIGIRREDQKMIFDKFFRVHTGNLHDVKGFGLGLYYVKLVVEEHNGKISLKSSPGKGTSFNLWFPEYKA